MHKYEVVRVLGRGSYGTASLVHLRSDASKQFVAKEVMVSHLNPSEQEGAKREAEVLAQLSHSNVVMHVESFVERGSLFIVMDYADGGDLSSAVARRRERRDDFAEGEVMNIFVQICLALRHIHAHNILHRDLKSGNVFLTSKGLVKLGDFGIAKVLDGTDACAQTQIGTPYYLSPEVCENQPYGKKTDVWSLGVILYELMTLQLPFQAQSLPALIFKICTAEYPPVPSDARCAELIELVGSLLQKEEQHRPTVTAILKQPFVQTHISKLLSYTIQNGAGGMEKDAQPSTPSQEAIRPPLVAANELRHPAEPQITQAEADRLREESRVELQQFLAQRPSRQRQVSRDKIRQPSPQPLADHTSPRRVIDAREQFLQNRAAANANKQRAIAELHASPVPWSVSDTEEYPSDFSEDRDHLSQQRTQRIAEVTRDVYLSNRLRYAENKRRADMELHGYSDSDLLTVKAKRNEEDDRINHAERVKKEVQRKKMQEREEHERKLEEVRLQMRLDRKRIEARHAEQSGDVDQNDESATAIHDQPQFASFDSPDSQPPSNQKAVAFDIQLDQPKVVKKPHKLEQKLLRGRQAPTSTDAAAVAEGRRVMEGMRKRRQSAAEIRAQTRRDIARLTEQRARRKEVVVRRVNLDQVAAPTLPTRNSSSDDTILHQYLETQAKLSDSEQTSSQWRKSHKTKSMPEFEQDVESLLEATDAQSQRDKQDDSESDTDVPGLQSSLINAMAEVEDEADEPLDLK